MPWSSKYFVLAELECACGCDILPDIGFLERLESAREMYNKPMVITSGMRCAEYQFYLNPSVRLSGHIGHGVDVRCSTSWDRWELFQALLRAGFNRIGFYDGHVHFDCHPQLPKNKIWLGKSK